MMYKPSEHKIHSYSKRIVLIATMSAILIVGKFCIALIPNIEVITTLIIVFAFVFGWYSVGAASVFCAADILIYPQTPDVIISYFIYWNLLAVIICILRAARIKSEIPYLIVGLIMTVFFGFLTSFVYTTMAGAPFWPLYLGGIPFYVAQFISTLVFMSVGFVPLTKSLERISKKLFPPSAKNK